MMNTALEHQSSGQLLCLGLNDYSLRSARSLANPQKWQGLGRNDHALWAYYHLAADKSLEVSLSLMPFSLSCSCKSPTQPCQHSLGLFIFINSTQSSLKKLKALLGFKKPRSRPSSIKL
ncbi:MAG: hypothetical protein R2865_05155 [Deinococcales bacterium]